MSQYTDGTVAVTNGSAVVSGTGTSFTANAAIGQLFTIQGSKVAYQIGSVDSDTQLTLSANYAGVTASGADYLVHTSYTEDGIPTLEDQDIETALIFKRAMMKIQELYSTTQPLDAELTALAGLISAADKMPYFTGAGAAALATLTSLSRTFIGQTSEQGMRDTIGAASKPSGIINGHCIIAQRSAATLSTSWQYGQVDRFVAKAEGTVGAGSISQSTGVIGEAGYAASLTGVTLTGSGAVLMGQRIESTMALNYKNQEAIPSLTVQHDAGVAIDYTVTVYKADVKDDFTAVTQIATSAAATSVPSGTPTQLSLPVANMGDCSNGIFVEARGACGAVTTKNFYFSDWKIERGSVVTGMPEINEYEERSNCLKYTWVPRSAGTGHSFSSGFIFSSTLFVSHINFPVPMRVPPQLIAVGTIRVQAIGISYVMTSPILNPVGIYGGRLDGTLSGAATGPALLRYDTSSDYLIFDSEL